MKKKIALSSLGVMGLVLISTQFNHVNQSQETTIITKQDEAKTTSNLNPEHLNQPATKISFSNVANILPHIEDLEIQKLDHHSKKHASALFKNLPPYQSGTSFFIKPNRNEKIIVPDALAAKALIIEEGAAYFGLNQQTNLEPLSSKRDTLGNKYYQYILTNQDIPVYGESVVIQVNSNNELDFIGGDGINELNIDAVNTPTLTSKQALDQFLSSLDNTTRGIIHGEPTLEYFYKTDEKSWSLTWKMTVESNSQYQLGTMHIDANNAQMLHFVSNIHSISRKVYTGSNACLRQRSRPALPGNLLFSEGNSNTNDESAQAAYTNTGHSYWFYKHFLGRHSYDDQDSTMVSSVHFQFEVPNDQYAACHQNNAFFMGTPYNQMIYGDGDGVNYIKPAKALDIAGHEVTHGVTFTESKLEYKDESGAINEAISDIFGAGIEAWVASGGNKDGNPQGGIVASANTWIGGEDAVSENNRRHMDNPTLDGQSTDNYNEIKRGQEDNGYVHSNSGIMNLAFYLLSEGGKHPRAQVSSNEVNGIGIEDALRIYYHANVNLFTSTTNFTKARQFLAQSALTLFGDCSAQYIALQQSFDAINVAGDWSCDTTNSTDNPSTDPTPANNNIGLNSRASASSSYSLYYAPKYAVDGQNNTVWVSQAIQNTNQDEWILLDLGTDKSFSQVTIHWKDYEYARNYAIYYWNNGWVEATNRQQYTAGSATLDFNQTTSRYVAVLMNAGFYGSFYTIREMEVH